MVRFKTYITEGKYPLRVKATTIGLARKIRSLSLRIAVQQDPQKQNQMIAQQAKLIAYMNGLGIAVSTEDPKLSNQIKTLSNRA